MDQSNAYICEIMSKGSKEALTVLTVTHVTHVERVERLHYIHNIDTFIAMSKGLKDYIMLQQGTYTLQCMLKHVKGVKSQNNFQPLQHT